MSPVYHHSESDLEIMETGFAAMTCGELFSSCPGYPYGRHPLVEDGDTPYWESDKYTKTCPCLRQCGNSAAMVSWANRYWRILSKAYANLCETELSRTEPTQIDKNVYRFVITINNILRGIRNHFRAKQTAESENVTTGCPNVDSAFFPNQTPVYYFCPSVCWGDSVHSFVSMWKKNITLLAVYLRLISHNATKYPESLIWTHRKDIEKKTKQLKMGMASVPICVNVAIAEFPKNNRFSYVSILKKHLLSKSRDRESVRDGKRILRIPVPHYSSYGVSCDIEGWSFCNIHFPTWSDFKAEDYDFILHLVSSSDRNANARLKNLYAKASSVMVLPCCRDKDQQERMAKRKQSMTLTEQLTIHEPIILARLTDKQNVQSDILKLLLDILCKVKRHSKPMPSSPMLPPPEPLFENPLDAIVLMVMNLYDWKQRGFCIKISDYQAEIRRCFNLLVPIIENGPRLPPFFKKPKSKKSKHGLWYTPPQTTNRHEMNALRLLVLQLARIDYCTNSRQVDENTLHREMTSVCQQVRNLGFLPSEKRKTHAKKNLSRLRQQKFHNLKEWIEDYIRRHAEEYWNPDLVKVLKGEISREYVVCSEKNGVKVEVRYESMLSFRITKE